MHPTSGRRVAVVFGGPSSEAAVSERSAQGVTRALTEAGHQPEMLELNPSLAKRLVDGAFDVAFPIAHGPLGEDGCLQGLFEVLELPYVGADVHASAVAANKPTAKALFRQAGVPVAEGLVLASRDVVDVEAVRAQLGVEVVVKPASGGSGIGVSRITADAPDFDAALRSAVLEAGKCDSSVVVEVLHKGLEVTCGVFHGSDGPVALPPTLILPKAAGWYDFVSRYKLDGSEHQCPAPLGEARVARVQELAVAAHNAIGARDLSRVDMVVGEALESIIVLEVNTLPGMTATSNYPEAAAVMGLSFPQLCSQLVELSLSRPRRLRPVVMPIPVGTEP